MKDETAAANARSRRLETALQRRDQEVEELKAKVAAMARERSALATLRVKTHAAAAGAATKQTLAGESEGGGRDTSAPKTPRKPSGETLSLSSRWHQWELDARKGDRRIALLLKSYKQMEGRCEAAHVELDMSRRELAGATRELEETREALEDLRANFDAAEALLNEELEGRARLEDKVRAESAARGKAESEAKKLAERVSTLEAEARELQSQRRELLHRTVKRDHRIDSLTKKLAGVAKEAEAEAAQRAKLEEEALRLEERLRVSRKRATALEGKSKVSEREMDKMVEELQAERLQLMMEIDIKEEECHMLAAMVSRAGSSRAAAAVSAGGSASKRAPPPLAEVPAGLGLKVGLGVSPLKTTDGGGHPPPPPPAAGSSPSGAAIQTGPTVTGADEVYKELAAAALSTASAAARRS